MTEEKRGPGRPKSPISEELRTKRKAQLAARRGGSTGQMRKRITVPEAGLDRDNFTYRVVNDTPGRVERLTTDDTWEVVPRVEGRDMDFHVDRSEDGSSMRGRLLRKPKDWYAEDQAAKQEQIDREMTLIKRGVVRGASGATLENGLSYDTGIQIEE